MFSFKKTKLGDIEEKIIRAINRITANPMYKDSITLQAAHDDLYEARTMVLNYANELKEKSNG